MSPLTPDHISLLCWIGSHEHVYGVGPTVGKLGRQRKIGSSQNLAQVCRLVDYGYCERKAARGALRVTLTEKGWAELGGKSVAA